MVHDMTILLKDWAAAVTFVGVPGAVVVSSPIPLDDWVVAETYEDCGLLPILFSTSTL
jgi:hypothetical protein